MSFFHQNVPFSFRKIENQLINQNKKNQIAQKNMPHLNKSEFFSPSPAIDISKLQKEKKHFSLYNNYSTIFSRNQVNKDSIKRNNSRNDEKIFNNINNSMKIKHIQLNKIKINRIKNSKKKIDTLHNLDQKNNSLPKININKVIPFSSLDESKKNDEKRTNSVKYIFNYANNRKVKLISKIQLNDNICNDDVSYEEILNSEFPFYRPARHSENSFGKIISYGVNTYQGLIRKYNEDRVTILINPLLVKKDSNIDKNYENYKISYFSIYDGHGGNKCCDFLKKYLHSYIMESVYFPSEPIKAIEEGFALCEKNFTNLVYLKSELLDTSGSCAIIILVINDTCYIVNLGDSRALYSYNDGKKFYQISRDHKPNDPMEKNRIYLAGGSIYQSKINSLNDLIVSGEQMIERNEKKPFRIFPGGLSVSYILTNLVI